MRNVDWDAISHRLTAFLAQHGGHGHGRPCFTEKGKKGVVCAAAEGWV